uniref:Uncharacterized protein n=1 Tax=Anopheles atroparvus TaxID=41427 RepID=A0A182IZG2_ANOAO
MKHSLLLLPLAGLITLATAQYGPAPPRLNIPGAIALPPIREERLLPQQPPQVIRVRRPGAVRLAAPNAIHHQQPSALPKFHDPSTAEHKPVTEEPEDDFRPAFIPQLQQPHNYPSPAPPSPVATPATLQHPIPADQQANERELQQNAEQDRKRKPVAQILRKWRDEHEDGSITWGFENDDGSFKEETIGIDCVTRGRYGYVDPDGEKREYNYETGIQCDPNRRDEDEDDNLEVDYQENKAKHASKQR